MSGETLGGALVVWREREEWWCEEGNWNGNVKRESWNSGVRSGTGMIVQLKW